MVWSIEHFKKYLLGRGFRLRTDHRALLSALSSNKGKKTEHLARKDMRWADYLSRHPRAPALPISEFDQNFLVSVTNKMKTFTAKLASLSKNNKVTRGCYRHVNQSSRAVNHERANAAQSKDSCAKDTHKCSCVIQPLQISRLNSFSSKQCVHRSNLT